MIIEEFKKFVEIERKKYCVKDNNLFVLSFKEIVRYYNFLQIIFKRYKDSCKERDEHNLRLFKVLKPLEKMKEGTLSVEQLQALDECEKINQKIEFEIESFFVFAKIFVDKCACSFEFYFGEAEGVKFKSHNKLVKNLLKFSEIKKLSILPEFLELAKKIKNEVLYFRDKKIVHESSPRRFRFLTKTGMCITSLYPSEHDVDMVSIPLDELILNIQEYILKFMQVIQLNSERSKLKIK